MRRSDREIKEFDKIVEVMRKCDVCRVAINDEKYPYILPLNFGMDVIDYIFMERMKVRNMSYLRRIIM